MVNVSIDVTDLGGEARPGDKVVFWRPRMGGSATHAGRVISTAPVTVFLTDGKATVSNVEPGEMTVLLQCRGVESQGPVTVGVPDGDHTVTLRALLESQFEYAPPIVSAVQEAASNASASEEAAIRAQVRSEAAADRAEDRVDEAINNGAELVRAEVKQDADRAVSARQAATQSESKAKASEGAAASSASNAAASESAAKQSEDNAGDYAAVATTAATEAVGAMESASGAAASIANSVSAAAGHADRASQSESGAAAYAQNASDAADRVGSAEQVGVWARQAQDASDRIGTAEQVGVWADESSAAASLASTSASKAKISETNAATHEANSLSAAERAEFAAEETIQQVSGDFATRNYADAKDWHKGPITNDHLTMADVGVGAWNIAARNHATRFGLPMDYGSLQVMQIGLSKTAFFIGQSTGMWINASNGTAWGEWQQISESSEGNIQGGAVGLKTVAMALTAGSLLDGVAGRYRVLAQVTAPVVRWRVHVESRRMLSNTTSAFTLGNVYIGNHSGSGVMSGQQQIKSGDSTVAAGGEWVSPWMDANLLSNETLIDVSVSGSELYRSQATSWVYEGGSWVSSKNSPVAIWVELETYDQVPVVGMIGDSTGAGQGADRPVFDSALYIAARKNKFIPMAYAYPGSSMQSINNYGFHIFQRWAHLDKPDSVIIQSGSNDIHAGTSTSELQTRFVNLMETAEKISPVVIGATVKARYPNSGAHQTTLNAHNAFVKTRTNGNRDYIDFYQALSPSGTVAAPDAADAAHLTTSGHQKLATAFDNVTVSRPAWVDTAKELDTKADKSYVDQRVPIDSFTGTGSPEGKVTAPVGSVYTDTAATNGAIRWIKTSGTGNTGWRVEYGDTGWRDITSTFDPPLQSGTVRIRKTPAEVQLLFYYAQATDGAVSTLSSSFGTGASTHFPLYSAGGANSGVALSHYSGRLTIQRTSAQINGVFTLPSTTAWPATLPGTPL